MKARLFGKKLVEKNKGSATLEILLAFTVLIISLSTVILVFFGNQSLTVDSVTNNEALYKAQKILEDARTLSRKDFLSLISTSTSEDSGGLLYQKSLIIDDVTMCKKQAIGSILWATTTPRQQKIELTTMLTDTETALALGGDCIDNPPISNWENPQRFASDTMSPGKPTALDELTRMVYIGADKAPFLYIASTSYATLGQNSGLLVTYSNGFDLKHTPASLDTVRYPSLNKTFTFLAIASSTKQLAIADVTDIFNPTVIYRGLSSCVAGGSPQGQLVAYYKNTLYLTTLYTSGPEFHIFDVTNPTNPVEYPIGGVACKGFELGNSVNDMVIIDQVISGTIKRYVYMATDEINKELRVFDVTNPLNIIEIFSANKDLPGAQNGMSLYNIGNKLYLGRQSTPGGADLYIYDISNPALGLPLLGSVDIGTGVNAIRVAGRFAFIATPKVNQEFQVWNISNPTSITNISKYNFGNVVNRGIDYNPDFIYSTGQSTPNFQIIYSP